MGNFYKQASKGIQTLKDLVPERDLHLIIMPTEACNFRCTYCYEDYAIGQMPSSVVSSIKLLLNRRAPELESLYLSWFGGEPLIAKNTILEICTHAKELAELHPQLRYSSGMTTNASLLTISTLSEMSKVGVYDYQISLDGPREVHNLSRIRAGGGKTYDCIWNNLLSIRDSNEPVNVLLRVHFTAENFNRIYELVDDIRREFIQDQRFSVFFKAVARLGGANDSNIPIMSKHEKARVIKTLKERLYGNDFTDSATELNACYASRPNSLVIRANGNIGKCTVALNDDRNNIGNILSDGTLKLDSKRLNLWLRGLVTLDSKTLICPLIDLPDDENSFSIQGTLALK